MIKTLHFILLSIYAVGTLLLPLGDFSTLKDIPGMYTHCKMTEDKDMTVIDFVTDHLLNIDGVFDKHKGGDEQKPHNPSPNHSIASILAFEATPVYPSIDKQIYPAEKKVYILQAEINFHSDYIANIFRPPIVA